MLVAGFTLIYSLGEPAILLQYTRMSLVGNRAGLMTYSPSLAPTCQALMLEQSGAAENTQVAHIHMLIGVRARDIAQTRVDIDENWPKRWVQYQF